MPNKYYLREDRTSVAPTIKEPEYVHGSAAYDKAAEQFRNHLRSLPALTVDPEYLKSLKPGWFEGVEMYECAIVPWASSWHLCSLDEYNEHEENCRRLTIIAPQEAEKGQEGELQCEQNGPCSTTEPYEKEIIAGGILCGGCGRRRPGTKYILPATPQPVTGEFKYQALWSYGQGSDWTDCTKEEFMNEPGTRRRIVKVEKPRPSDAVEFAEWMADNGVQLWDKGEKGDNLRQFEYNFISYTKEEIYQIFLEFKSKQPTP